MKEVVKLLLEKETVKSEELYKMFSAYKNALAENKDAWAFLHKGPLHLQGLLIYCIGKIKFFLYNKEWDMSIIILLYKSWKKWKNKLKYNNVKAKNWNKLNIFIA